MIISASPKSNYTKNPFGGRKIIKGRTVELVKDCNFSLVVASTSVSYPILFEKPIVFFSTNDIANNYGSYKVLPQYWAKILNCNYYRIDDLVKSSVIKINRVDKQSYTEYKYNYLTTKESECKLTKDIVIEYFNYYFAH